MRTRIFFSSVGGIVLAFAAITLSATAHATTRENIVVLDIYLANDIGVENAGRIATRWLTDSVVRVAPQARMITGKQAAELARLRLPLTADGISPSAARTLMKSIDATHLLGGEIFLWNDKYGVNLRMISLSDVNKVRIERAWAESADEIPARIEELAGLLFSPPGRTESETTPSVLPKSEKMEIEQDRLPPKVDALLKSHPEMVYIPAGEFLMGNDDDSDADNMPVDPSRREGVSRFMLLAAEKPEHTVNVDSFLIDKHEVTNAEYNKFKPNHNFSPEHAGHPVTGISWYDAASYAAWAGKRLPTEKEWEKAARGKDGRKWPWGNVFKRGLCNLGKEIAPVGSFTGDKSPYGVRDMAGNVQEWTASDFAGYPGSTIKNITFDPKKKVVRGSYYGGNDFLARCSMRFCALPGSPGVKPQGENYGYIGFRCVMDID